MRGGAATEASLGAEPDQRAASTIGVALARAKFIS